MGRRPGLLQSLIAQRADVEHEEGHPDHEHQPHRQDVPKGAGVEGEQECEVSASGEGMVTIAKKRRSWKNNVIVMTNSSHQRPRLNWRRPEP